MGWTWFHREPGRETIAETMQKEWGPGVEFLETAVVGMKTFYAACRSLDRETGLPRNSEVWAAVVLLNYAPHDQYNFGYKDMDETVGPCESDAPERILKLLTPTESQWANEWRARCWANIEKNRADRKKAKTVQIGALIDFGRVMKFSNGEAYQRLFYAGGNAFATRYQGSGRLKIPQWRSYDWSVARPADEMAELYQRNQELWNERHALVDTVPAAKEAGPEALAALRERINRIVNEASAISDILSDKEFRELQYAESVTPVTA